MASQGLGSARLEESVSSARCVSVLTWSSMGCPSLCVPSMIGSVGAAGAVVWGNMVKLGDSGGLLQVLRADQTDHGLASAALALYIQAPLHDRNPRKSHSSTCVEFFPCPSWSERRLRRSNEASRLVSDMIGRFRRHRKLTSTTIPEADIFGFCRPTEQLPNYTITCHQPLLNLASPNHLGFGSVRKLSFGVNPRSGLNYK